MSIRLDPRRLGVLKRMAAEAGVRPGDLVRVWTEERLDAERTGTATGGPNLAEQLAALASRVATLESASRSDATAAPIAQPSEPEAAAATSPAPDRAAAEETPAAKTPAAETPAEAPAKRKRATKVGASPKTPRVPLHEEMIAVLAERGPMTAGDLAAAVAERGRYAPPRSGKPIDAAMISQRVSNPTYRGRFTRNEGRIGLAE